MSFEDKLKTNCVKSLRDPNSEVYMEELNDALNKLDKEGALKGSKPKPKSFMGKTMDAAFEFWVNNLLGGPTTQLKNIASTTVPLVVRVPETLAAAGISRFAGKGERVHFREALAEAQGLVEGSRDVIKFLGKRFTDISSYGKGNEEILDQMDIPRELSMQSKIEFHKRAITGENIDNEILKRASNYMGAAVNMPGKALTTTDVLFKIMNYRAGTSKFAMRQVLEEGLEGEAAARKYEEVMTSIRENRNKVLTDKGVAEADYRVYTQRPDGDWNRWMAEKGHDLPGMRWIVPFRRTMVNVINYGVERSPFALVRSGTRKALLEGTNAERSEALARMATGSALIMGLYSMLADRMDGEAPHNAMERDIWEGRGHKQDSIQFGNTYVPLDAFGQMSPFFKALARYSDFQSNRPEVLEGDDNDNLQMTIAGEILMATADAMMQEHWLPNITRLAGSIERARRENDGAPIVREIASMGRSLWPRPLKMYQQATDKVNYDTPGSFDGIIQNIPTVANGMLEPEINLYGYPMRHDRFKKQYPEDKAFDEILRLKVPLPRAERSPMSTKMTRSEYRQYMVISGQGVPGVTPSLRDSLHKLIESDNYKNLKHDEGRIMRIRRIIKRHRKIAREYMLYNSDWGKRAMQKKQQQAKFNYEM